MELPESPRPTSGSWGALSAAAARHRDLLGLPLQALPGGADRDDGSLRDRTASIDSFLRAWSPGEPPHPAANGSPRPLWTPSDLRHLAHLPMPALVDEWSSRLARAPVAVSDLLRPDCDHASVWSDLPSGDFDLDGRGVDYTRGMAGFQAARWSGASRLLDLLGALAGEGTYLDVLGGDGYVWRLLVALRSTSDGSSRSAARLVTNDVSRHMFLQAGLWGTATREEAGRLTRTFRPACFDGVLIAYGTHHIENLPDAIANAAQVVRPGRPVVIHDFFDEGPVGRWFGEVVDRWGKTRHEMPHVGPLQMAVELYLAGLRDVELFEMSDPFLFVAEDGSQAGARRVAKDYLAGMYGLEESLLVRQGRLEEVVREVMSYPELGRTGVFRGDYVQVPRFAVVSRAWRPRDVAAPPGPRDRALVARLAAVLRAGPELARDLPGEVRRLWFSENGRRWGVPDDRRREFLRWADGLERLSRLPAQEARTQGKQESLRDEPRGPRPVSGPLDPYADQEVDD